MSDERVTRFELRRVGKHHHYDVMVGGNFVGEIRRALVGVWVGAMSGGIELGASFSSKDEALAAVISRSNQLGMAGRS